MRALFCLITLLLPVQMACRPKGTVADKVYRVQENDPVVVAAVEAARGELPFFFQRLASPAMGDSHFSVKIRVQDTHGVEYFWLTELVRSGRRVSGVVDQQPQIVRSVQYGQSISVTEDEVVDWLLMEKGRMKGNFTLRALKDTCPPEEVGPILQLLADSPSLRKPIEIAADRRPGAAHR